MLLLISPGTVLLLWMSREPKPVACIFFFSPFCSDLSLPIWSLVFAPLFGLPAPLVFIPSSHLTNTNFTVTHIKWNIHNGSVSLIVSAADNEVHFYQLETGQLLWQQNKISIVVSRTCCYVLWNLPFVCGRHNKPTFILFIISILSICIDALPVSPSHYLLRQRELWPIQDTFKWPGLTNPKSAIKKTSNSKTDEIVATHNRTFSYKLPVLSSSPRRGPEVTWTIIQ